MESDDVSIRSVSELDIEDIAAIDEKIGGEYRPEVWERRIVYYARRDPDASLAAEADGEVVGFMLDEVRSGEFGLEEPTGWIEVLGVDPDFRGRAVGRRLAEAIVASFRDRGAKEIRTLVDDSMEDIKGFFEALGFAAAPITPMVLDLGGDGRGSADRD